MKAKRINAKPIPIMVTLLAAGISCVASIVQGVPFSVFTMRLLGSVVVFGILGIVLRVVIERSFKVMEEEPEEEPAEAEEQSELEDIRTEEDNASRQ